jgi:hypothetical protein
VGGREEKDPRDEEEEEVMKILKVRKGFATNSSSTHSLVIFNGKKQRPEDYLVSDGGFGWEFFTAASPEAKKRYLALTLRYALSEAANDAVTRAVISDWLSLDSNYVKELMSTDHYIDHQSVLCVPFSWDGKGPDRAFFGALTGFIMRSDVAVLGGNDNTEEQHPLGGFRLVLPRETWHEKWACRQDSRGFWTLFNRMSGTKVRMVFDEDSAIEPVKADAPELVDVKITDMCPYECAFCYQGSTGAGKHGSKDFIYDVARALGEMKVFEVALGGGETTLHPEFWYFLQLFRGEGVVPNFTTRNLSWLRDPKKVEIFKKYAGGFAFSTEKSEEVKELANLIENAGIDKSKVSIQYIVGSSLCGAHGVMMACAQEHLSCTLLGYKTNGRGAEFKSEPGDDWIAAMEYVKKEKGWYPTVGIDTALAAKDKARIEALEIPDWCFETVEGKFSMYIDAVAGKCGPSSYCEPVRMRGLPQERYSGKLEQAISKSFAAF